MQRRYACQALLGAVGGRPLCLKRLFPFRTEPDTAGDAIDDVLEALRDGNHLPADLVPFADAWGGNYFCVLSETGEIF